jgi:hypothetical protein
MKMLVTQIDESYAAPPGTLHLGSNGWVMDRPEKLKIRTNRSLKDFMQLVAGRENSCLPCLTRKAARAA